ncbi:GNAT family N-acetyltransferase [Enterococcus casseliflavus]|uniref:GNAT family N-acetyltransferase n=1 Tax=Enterococcus casseliflavus TaxID=37734 RepID=UPI0023DC5775|nr:GNAT family N-acetyltransferase [Enterococcus casseliflavus]WEL47676.1 GNAT family N-acetyltransferase [Enterococcus casseliflavus]
MNIKEVSSMNQKLEQQLIEVWESSVKATHTFLSESEIQAIKQYIPEALHHVPHLIVVESEQGEPAGFMGISDRNLEMLFIANEQRGKGLGKKLLAYGMENYFVNELGVNEQNPQAKGFYEHMGFEVYKRSELDEQGNPYPILYMKKVDKK